MYNRSSTVSIHPMLMFINHAGYFGIGHNAVSIHPMLMFIGEEKMAAVVEQCFNTSYVNVYHGYFCIGNDIIKFQYILC